MASNGQATENSTNLMSQLAATSSHHIEEFVKAQIATLMRFQQLNRHWLDRWQAEAKVFTDFSTKLTAARSLHEATKAYQELAERHWQMASEDAKRIMEDSEALALNGAQLFTNGRSKQQSLGA